MSEQHSDEPTCVLVGGSAAGFVQTDEVCGIAFRSTAPGRRAPHLVELRIQLK